MKTSCWGIQLLILNKLKTPCFGEIKEKKVLRRIVFFLTMPYFKLVSLQKHHSQKVIRCLQLEYGIDESYKLSIASSGAPVYAHLEVGFRIACVGSTFSIYSRLFALFCNPSLSAIMLQSLSSQLGLGSW